MNNIFKKTFLENLFVFIKQSFDFSGFVDKKEGCLEKIEKKLGWDAETRKKVREEKAAKKEAENLIDNNALQQGFHAGQQRITEVKVCVGF